MGKSGKGKKKAETVFLVCEESGDHNYALRRKPGGEKLKLKKYCPRTAQAHPARREEEIADWPPGTDEMGKRWRIHPHEAERIAFLERAAGVSPVVAQLLLCRGVSDPQQARMFLDAKLTGLRDPELLARLARRRRPHACRDPGRRKIVIYGDYDADGMSATGILFGCLRLLGADVGYYVPHRLDEGYGLNHEALRKLADARHRAGGLGRLRHRQLRRGRDRRGSWAWS